MANYPCSFDPLCSTPLGKHSSIVFKIPPFVDGSCRREPDFEHSFPSITGLCRPDGQGNGSFARRLKVGDRVIYWTNKVYDVNYLVAVLEVQEKFDSHSLASTWYRTRELPYPNNLMIRGNDCKPWLQTHQDPNCVDDPYALKAWDNEYKERASHHPDVAVCQFWKGIRFINDPPAFNVVEVFGRRVGTENPGALQENEWVAFEQWLHATLKNRYGSKYYDLNS